jgi:hypothetical protein
MSHPKSTNPDSTTHPNPTNLPNSPTTSPTLRFSFKAQRLLRTSIETCYQYIPIEQFTEQNWTDLTDTMDVFQAQIGQELDMPNTHYT